jgi:serine/threonine protein phosphatase PrpC
VHHAAFGFATVTEVDDRGAQLRWAREGHSSPTHVSRHMLHTSYRRCRPGGLLAKHLADPSLTRRLAADDPVAMLGLLLLDLGGPQPAADLEEWMHQLVDEANFAGWWGAVRVLAGVDDRFLLDDDHVGLAPGVTEADFAERALAEAPAEAPALPREAPAPVVAADAPPARPAVDAAWLWGSALNLGNALAALHAGGRSLLRRREAATHGAGWSLQADEEAGPTHADVHWAARRLVEDALGVVLPAEIPSAELVDLAPAVLPDFPPELLGVLRYALARDPALRPRDGLAFAHTLAVAHAVWASRADLPHRRGAELVAGFDTHIGTLKALAGQVNQDSFLLLGDPDHALVMVADGISTATAGSGDLASALAARSLRLQWSGHNEALRGAPVAEIHRFLLGALERANRVVAEAAVRLAGGDLSRHVPMGTTVVVGVTAGDTVHLAALGDSRAWLVGRHGVAPLLWDQNLNSVRLRQAAAGAPFAWDERGYALVGYLGHFDELGEPTLGPVMLTRVRLLPGEWLILASDGISDHAAEEEAGVYRIVERLVAEHGTGADASAAMRLARRLVLSANDGSGGDNATVLTLTLSA